MKKIFIILLFATNLVLGQEKQLISLDDCYESMMINYPLAGQDDIYTQANELKIINLKTAWLPNAELNAQATYQSDVLELNIDLPDDLPINLDLPQVSKDQYKATIDVNQLIYDWGRIKAAKQLESVNLKTNNQISQIELYKLKDQINRFYFAILILQRNEELLKVMLSELETKEKTIESGVKNGVILSSDLSVIKAENLKVNQSIKEIQNKRFASIRILSEITGIDLSKDVVLEISNYEIEKTEGINRSEITLFNYQKEKLDATSKIITKNNKPTAFAFAQLGYGKPGLNMTSDEFDSFYIAGVGLKWKFWDWKRTKNEKQILSFNKDLISIQINSFTKQVNMALYNERANIMSFEDAIKSDIEIIKLREEISESARSKLDNGIITSTDYITEISKETSAKINYETHKIQLIQSKVNYLYIKGEL